MTRKKVDVNSPRSVPRWLEGHSTLRAAFHSADSYGLLFALLVIDLFVVVGLPYTPYWIFFVNAPFAISILLLTLHTSRAPKRVMRWGYYLSTFVMLVAGIGLVGTIVQGGDPTSTPDWYGAVTGIISVLVILYLPVAILRRILGHEKVTIETILGALCVYLLLGFIFAGIFGTVDSISASTFALPHSQNSAANLTYLSFITLTTVGFGDVVPNGDFARSIVIFEALIGQVFLLTMLARLVSKFGTEGHGGKRSPEERNS